MHTMLAEVPGHFALLYGSAAALTVCCVAAAPPRPRLEPEPEPQVAASALTDDDLSVPTPLVRWLSIHGAAANRKEALALLSDGCVAVNGAVSTAPPQLIGPKDAVRCRGAAITPQRWHRHVLLHKPPGHLSTRREVRQLKGGGFEEDTRPTVYDLLDAETEARHCMAVGRLDVDTTGALLFTSNGALAHRLLGPQFHVSKLYR